MTKTATYTFGTLLVLWSSLPRAQTSPMVEVLFLEVYVNGRPAESLLRIEREAQSFRAEVDHPLWLPEQIRAQAQGSVDLCALASVQCEYDSTRQRLDLTFPAELFDVQHFAFGTRELPPLSRIGSGLLNYDAYYANLGTNEEFLDVIHQFRISGEYGIFESNGNWQKELGHRDPTLELESRYTRYHTFWHYNDEAKMRFYRVGDFVTAPSMMGRQARLGGFQIASDFSLNPSFLSYPFPELSGSSVLPSDVEVFINSNRLYSGNLEPGPYTIGATNTLVGLNQATVLTRDIRGNLTQRTLQFYFAPELLRKGVSSYSLQLGALRENYGAESNDYAKNALMIGNYRYGLTDNHTFGTHFEFGDGLKNMSAEWETNLQTRGIFSLGLAYGERNEQQGISWQASYRFTDRKWGLFLEHREREEGYQDLVNFANTASFSSESRVNLSFPLQRGQFGIGYFSLKPFSRPKEELISGYFSRAFGNVNATLNASYDYQSGNTSANLYISIPLGRKGRTSVRQSHSSSDPAQTLLSYTSASSVENRLKYGFTTAIQRENYSVYGSYRTDSVELSSGASRSVFNDMLWARVAGSVVYTQNELFLGNRIIDGFAIVDTGDFANVPVRKENQLIGSTNDDGKLLVSGLNAYNLSRFAIDSTTLPINTSLESPTANVATARNMGALVEFPIAYSHAALLLLEHENKPVSVGSPVTLNDHPELHYVGWEGELYLEGLQQQNSLTIELNDSTCRVTFTFDAVDDVIPVIGPLNCIKEN